jgi:hypothetical protein
VAGVINLLQYLPLNAFEHFDSDDQAYAQAEYTSYLCFALWHLPNVFNRPWGGSISGFTNSLPYQWTLASRLSAAVATPRFYFGRSKHAPIDIASGYNAVTSRHLYDGRNWKTANGIQASSDEHILAYIRPHGSPVIATCIDNTIWLSSLGGQPLNLDTTIIGSLVADFNKHFYLSVSEFLFFFAPDARRAWTLGSAQAGLELDILPDVIQLEAMECLAAKLSNSPC